MAVTVVCAATVHCIVAAARTNAEFTVVEPDTGIDDVGADPGSGAGVGIRGAQRKRALVHSVQSPGGVGLSGDNSGEAVECVGVDIVGPHSMLPGHRGWIGPLVQSDDEPACDVGSCCCLSS